MPTKAAKSVIPAVDPVAARTATRTTRGGTKKPAKPAATKPRAGAADKPARAKKPAATPAQVRETPLAGELVSVRREVEEVTATCREVHSRLAAIREDLDRSATEVRGFTKAAERSREQTEQVEEAIARIGQELAATQGRFAPPEESLAKPLDEPDATPQAQGRAGERPEAFELPEVSALPPDEQADDIRDRLVRLLNDAWAVEKEQVELLQTLADDCGDRELRALLEAHRADSQERQQIVAARLGAFGSKPAGGRGLLGQFVTRLWDAVQSPRDQPDRALRAVLKALSTAEFQAGQYAALHATAGFAGDDTTAGLAAACFREERDRASQLRAALVAAVGRASRR